MDEAPGSPSRRSSISPIPGSHRSNGRPPSETGPENKSGRYSVTALYSIAAENDVDVDDALSQAQRRLKLLKSQISLQSKQNFVLEKDVRYLDSRIALLIQNRIALDETEVVAQLGDSSSHDEDHHLDEKSLQSSPRYVSSLVRNASLSEIDSLLQTVMFTLYGNQYESREENLLLTMFQSVLAAQFENTSEINAQIRANTPVSRLMTTYTRRGPGQSYLKETIAPKIDAVLLHGDLDLEINPLKIHEKATSAPQNDTAHLELPNGMSAEEISQNPSVQKLIQSRASSLVDIGNGFVEAVVESLDRVPYGIRWICKQIRSLAKRKYPNVPEHAICSLIGGFFFLRFINPAIVTPEAYMLVENSPEENSRRVLVLLAKMLQNLANKPSYAKEPYMLCVKDFVDFNLKRINRFLNELCEVGDFYDRLELDQYIALSRKDLDVDVNVNELFNMHEILRKHISIFQSENDRNLRDLLCELGKAPGQVSRKENISMRLHLSNRWESFVEGIADTIDVPRAELVFMETKSIFTQIVRTLPSKSKITKFPLNFQLIADTTAKASDPVLVRKAIRALELLRELREDGDPTNVGVTMTALRNEVEQELAHLGSLKDKIDVEIASLASVHKTICDHNEYLRSQLDTYKSYLENVRTQSRSTKGSERSLKAGHGGVGLVAIGGKERKNLPQALGPFRFSHQKLEREGVIAESNIPENRQSNIYFNFVSPSAGSFTVSLHYRGRANFLLELDLQIDDLLEMQKQGSQLIDLEYVKFDVSKTLALLHKRFVRG